MVAASNTLPPASSVLADEACDEVALDAVLLAAAVVALDAVLLAAAELDADWPEQALNPSNAARASAAAAVATKVFDLVIGVLCPLLPACCFKASQAFDNDGSRNLRTFIEEYNS